MVDWPAAVAGRTIAGSAVVHLVDRNDLPLIWASQGGHSHCHPTMLGSSLNHIRQMTLADSQKKSVFVRHSMVAVFESVPMSADHFLKVKN